MSELEKGVMRTCKVCKCRTNLGSEHDCVTALIEIKKNSDAAVNRMLTNRDKRISELESQLEAYQKQALDELARMGQEIEQASKASVEDAIKYLKNKEYTTVHQDYALRWMEQYLSEQKES